MLLAPFGSVWSAGARIKASAYAKGVRGAKRLPGIVVSVGNLTVGGTGKTPTVIWLAERMAATGKRVGILTRGYRGPSDNGVAQSDEVAILHSRLGEGVPVAVGADRFASGMKLAEKGIEYFVLDDAFQHLQLARDADVVMLDATDPFGGGRCLPAGRLREPISSLGRADIVVITRAERAPAVESRVLRHTDAPIFYATTRLCDVVKLGDSNLASKPALDDCRARKFFAFCGIGNGAAFFADLKTWGFTIVGSEAYPDHHRYDQIDATELEARCRATEADALICTEKDIFNLRGVEFSSTPVFVARISLRVHDSEGFCTALRAAIEQNRAEAPR